MINIPVSETEGILEPFYDGGDSYVNHQKYSSLTKYKVTREGAAYQAWSFAGVELLAGETFVMERECDVDISDFDALRLFWAAEPSVRVQVICNGRVCVDERGMGKMEYADGSTNEKRLTKLAFKFENTSDASQSAQILYLGTRSLARTGKAAPFTDEWEGCFADSPDFGIFSERLISREDFAALVGKLQTAQYKECYDSMKKDAKAAMEKPPEALIGKAIHNRFRDNPNYFTGSVIALAFVGQAEQNEAMLKMACRYALSLASCSYWCTDKMEEIPTVTWHHRSFTETSACAAIAAAICFAGKYLSWHGRNILYNSLIMKGLPRIEADLMTMEYIYSMNQGVWFCMGYIIALAVLSEAYPRYGKRLDEAETLFEEMINKALHSDGSGGEGAGYWSETVNVYLIGVYFLARRRNLSIESFVGRKLDKTSEFGLFMLDEKGEKLPVNDCHRGRYPALLCNLMARITGDLRWVAVAARPAECGLRGLFYLLAAKPTETGGSFKPAEFKVFRDVGMTSLYRGGIHFFGVSGQSNTTHCHHDKGSFLIYKDGEPLIADFGVGTYNLPSRVYMAEWHNLCVPIGKEGALDQTDTRFDKNAGALLLKSKYENGSFEWISDNSAAWDKKYIKKNIRTVTSENPNIFMIIDEFEFTEPMPVSFRLNLYDMEAVNVRPVDWIPESKNITETPDFEGKTVYQLRLDAPAGEKIKLTTKIIVN